MLRSEGRARTRTLRAGAGDLCPLFEISEGWSHESGSGSLSAAIISAANI